MKSHRYLTSGLIGLTSSLAIAGEPLPTPEASGTPDFMDKIKFRGNVRARYEFRETEPLDESNSGTMRAHLGLEIGEFNGFSAFVQGEFTEGLMRDFASSAGPTTSPRKPGNTVIADPDNHELNQAYIQYAKDGFFAKVGRQNIVRGAAQHIGNVIWRQNMQTFEAAQIGYKEEKFSVSYVYSDRALRIFGAQSNDGPPGPTLRDFEGDFHFIDANYKTDFGEVGGFIYLVDIENNLNVGESNTYGGFTKAGGLYAEFAFQDGTSNLAGGDYTSAYAHLHYTTPLAGGNVKFACEYLGDHFKTPFSTVHKFGGFADAFIGQRIGLNETNGYNGITDIHVSYAKKGLPGDINFVGTLHTFLDGKADEAYGYEADCVLTKKFTPDLLGLLKCAYFSGENQFEDIKQVTAELNFSF